MYKRLAKNIRCFIARYCNKKLSVKFKFYTYESLLIRLFIPNEFGESRC